MQRFPFASRVALLVVRRVGPGPPGPLDVGVRADFPGQESNGPEPARHAPGDDQQRDPSGPDAKPADGERGSPGGLPTFGQFGQCVPAGPAPAALDTGPIPRRPSGRGARGRGRRAGPDPRRSGEDTLGRCVKTLSLPRLVRHRLGRSVGADRHAQGVPEPRRIDEPVDEVVVPDGISAGATDSCRRSRRRRGCRRVWSRGRAGGRAGSTSIEPARARSARFEPSVDRATRHSARGVTRNAAARRCRDDPL